jgi:hypothetical protein
MAPAPVVRRGLHAVTSFGKQDLLQVMKVNISGDGLVKGA